MEKSEELPNNLNVGIWLGVIAAFLMFVYYPILEPLLSRFDARDSYYSHGYLVPFVTAFLIWNKRESIAAIPLQGTLWGLPLIIGALLMHVVSYFLKINFPSYVSCLIAIFGIVLFLGGWRFTKALTFPLGFLFFMIPLPEMMIHSITFNMKLLATEISTFIVNFIGVEATFQGSRIFFQDGFLWVGDPCSGLRSLISFLALGTVLVQLVPGASWKKVILFLSVIPIALLSNVARIVILTIASYIYGSQVADGFLHDLTGILVFVFGFIGLTIVMGVLKCRPSPEKA